MSAEKIEIQTFFGKCRCCLSYGYIKNMWTEHQFEGEAEVYGEMLVQCFAMVWEVTEDSIDQDQICEQCISRLRDAHNFKKIILDSQEQLVQQIDEDNKNNIKEERLEEDFVEEHSDMGEDTADTMNKDIEYTIDTADSPSVRDNKIIIKEERLEEDFVEEHSDMGEDTADTMNKDIEYTIDTADSPSVRDNKIIIKEERLEEDYVEEHSDMGEDTADTMNEERIEYTIDTADSSSVKDETEYEEIEFLEDEDNAGVKETVDTDSSQATDPWKQARRKKQPREPIPEGDGDTPKRKWPKKLPKSERLKTYKQYSEIDLWKCIEEVKNNVMTISEASLKYDIPKKTLHAKIRREGQSGNPDPNRDKMYKLISEIKAILTFTNATPYKSKNVRYYCAYCTTDGPQFEDPDDLRTHTRVEHVAHRTEKIEYAMRPYWMNEVIKVDIENLLCTVCCILIGSWNEMFKHLIEKHNVVLDQAYTRIIPYILQPNLQCALCKESFSNYLHLDGHMNTHYNNYVCDDCGDTFVSQNRIKQHVKLHNVGKYECRFCDKVFTLSKYRKKHEELIHELVSKFKCIYCPEKFTGEYLRHMHCLENHPEKIKTITCEYCGDIFTWRQYYLRHIRKKHENRNT